MLGRREVGAAGAAAVMAGLAVFVAGVEGDEVVEVRVQAQPAAAPDQTSGQVVWAEKGDVLLYDDETGRRRALTNDGASRHQWQPRFRDASHVTYLTTEHEHGSDPTLMEVDLASGGRQVLKRLSGWVRTYSWSPDGKTLAYFATTVDGAATELHIAGDGAALARPFAAILGRGGFVDYDEARIEWSRDGRRFLLLDTALDTQQDETLYVLNADGSDAAPARAGTWARFSADGRTIYCDCSTTSKADAPWSWQAIDVSTGAWKALPIQAAGRPSLSPDGRLLAFDDSADTPSVHVLDLRHPAAQPRLLARGALAPIWLRPALVAVTDTRPCPDTEDECMAGGHGAMFEPAGTASAIDLNTGDRSPLPPILTDGADTESASH